MDVEYPARAAPAVRKETLVGIVGYAGAAATVAGTVTVVTRQTQIDGLSEGASLAIALVMAAVLVVAGLAIGDRAPDAFQRMRSVLWFSAVGPFGVASVLFWLNIADLGAKTAATLAGAVTAVFSLVLWLMLRRTLQQIAFFLTAVGAITALAVPNGIGSTSDLDGPLLVVWLSGLAWFIGGAIEIVRPPKTARVLGAVVGLVGTLEMLSVSFWLAIALMSLTSLLLLAVGDRKDDRAVAGLGIAGILVATATAVTRAAGGCSSTEFRATCPEGPAAAAIVIGLVLLGGAIAAVRMSAPKDEPPIPPPPVPPTETRAPGLEA